LPGMGEPARSQLELSTVRSEGREARRDSLERKKKQTPFKFLRKGNWNRETGSVAQTKKRNREHPNKYREPNGGGARGETSKNSSRVEKKQRLKREQKT